MTSTIQQRLARRFDQICFVVTDIHSAMAYHEKANGIPVWNLAEHLARNQVEKTYYSQPGDFQFSCAYGYAGDTIIELARHDGGNSVYKDWLDTHGPGLHHIGFRLDDAAEFAEAEAHYESLGLKKAMSGLAQGACRWAYYDTREQIGCFSEIYYLDGMMPAVWEQMKRGEKVQIGG